MQDVKKSFKASASFPTSKHFSPWLCSHAHYIGRVGIQSASSIVYQGGRKKSNFRNAILAIYRRKSLTYLKGKSITSRRRNTILFPQLISFGLSPLKGFLSLQPCLKHCFQNCGDKMTQSSEARLGLHFVFVKNALVFIDPKIRVTRAPLSAPL